MFPNNELKIMVPGCRVIAAEVMEDGSCLLKLEQATAEGTTTNHQNDNFKLVRASELSTSDDFLKYTTKTPAEMAFKVAVEKVITAGVKDFYRPTLDPSFDGDGKICYQAGLKPAVGKSFASWEEIAKKMGYQLGTDSEYIAFLAVLIKEAPNYGKTYEWAWNAVCNDSKELGHYKNSCDAKCVFETTGKRESLGYYDLGNTYKILADRNGNGHWLAGGDYYNDSYSEPLARLFHDCYGRSGKENYGTGWFVFYEG